MYIKSYLKPVFWKKTLLSVNTITVFFSAIGAFCTFATACEFAFEGARTWFQSCWLFFLLIAIVYTIVHQRPVFSISEKLNGTDIKIEIRIADIFSVKDVALVIPSNSSFDTIVNEKLVSPKSLHGIFIQKFYENHHEFDLEIENTLKNEQVVNRRESRVNGVNLRF